MHKDVVKQVLALLPERIVYVSCNPSTLARDLGLLKEAYQALEVQPVDLFPHTYHIESVAMLVKIKSGRNKG
jgi:23S rRNA (uracil1939-C5)-methyltransferase